MNDKATTSEAETTAEEAGGTRKKSGKRRWLRRIFLVFALLLLMIGALVAALPSILSSDAVCKQVADWAGKVLGCDVRIEGLAFSWTRGIALRDLAVRDRSGEELLALKSLTCDYEVLPLLSGSVVVRELNVIEPRVWIRRRKDGSFNIDGLLPNPPPGAPASPVPPPSPRAPFLLPPITLRMKVKNATAEFLDEATGEMVAVRKLNLSVDLPSLLETMTVKSDFDLSAKGNTEHVSLVMTGSIAEGGTIDPQKAKASLELVSAFLTVKGSVDMQALGRGGEKEGGRMEVTCNLGHLATRYGALLGLPPGMTFSGDTHTTLSVTGEADSPRVAGKTDVRNLIVVLPPSSKDDQTAEPTTLPTLTFTLFHDVAYDAPQSLVRLERMDLQSEFATLTSSGTLANPESTRHLDYALQATADLDRISKTFAAFIPPELSLKGAAALRAEVSGDLLAAPDGDPYAPLRALTVEAQAELDQLVYEKSGVRTIVSEVKAAPIVLRDGRLDLPAAFVVNGGSTKTRLKADFTESTPKFETTVKATNITINQDVELLGYFIPLMILPKDGTVTTTLDLDLTAEGTNFDWPTLRKNLVANGKLKLNQGSVSGGEVVSAVLGLLGESDTFDFDGMTSAFALNKGRIESKSIEIDSKSLDFALSGWTSIVPDPETGGYAMHYEAGNELLKKYAGKELARYSALLGGELDSFSPLLITGTIQKPKVKLNLPTITRAVEGILGNAIQEELLDKILGGKGKDKPDLKKLEDIGKDLLKGLFGND